MKKTLTTAFCLSVLFMGSQLSMAANTNTAKQIAKQTVKTTVSDVTKETTDKKQPPKFGKKPPKRPPMLKLEEELNLTEQQKAKAKENRIKGRKEMKPVMDEIRAKKEAVLDVMDSDLSKEEQQAKIKELQSEIKKLHEKANTIREKNMKEFEKILDKEQKAKFEKIKKEHIPGGGKCKKCARQTPPPPLPPEEE